MKLETVGAVVGALIMAGVAWAMWVFQQRELDRALSHLSHLS